MIFKKSLVLPIAAFVVALTSQSVMAQSEAVSGTYKAEPKHRYITFSYSHMGYSNPWLRWRDWDATLEWNVETPEDSSISVVIDVASVDSGVDEFDGHLKSDLLFDVENHPEITFVSTSLTKTGDKTGTMAGDLTIMDVTKPVTLDVVFNNAGFSERDGIYKIGFSAKTSVNRSDFGLDYAVPYVSDKVDITIEAEFIMPAQSTE